MAAVLAADGGAPGAAHASRRRVRPATDTKRVAHASAAIDDDDEVDGSGCGDDVGGSEQPAARVGIRGGARGRRRRGAASAGRASDDGACVSGRRRRRDDAHLPSHEAHVDSDSGADGDGAAGDVVNVAADFAGGVAIPAPGGPSGGAPGGVRDHGSGAAAAPADGSDTTAAALAHAQHFEAAAARLVCRGDAVVVDGDPRTGRPRLVVAPPTLLLRPVWWRAMGGGSGAASGGLVGFRGSALVSVARTRATAPVARVSLRRAKGTAATLAAAAHLQAAAAAVAARNAAASRFADAVADDTAGFVDGLAALSDVAAQLPEATTALSTTRGQPRGAWDGAYAGSAVAAPGGGGGRALQSAGDVLIRRGAPNPSDAVGAAAHASAPAERVLRFAAAPAAAGPAAAGGDAPAALAVLVPPLMSASPGAPGAGAGAGVRVRAVAGVGGAPRTLVLVRAAGGAGGGGANGGTRLPVLQPVLVAAARLPGSTHAEVPTGNTPNLAAAAAVAAAADDDGGGGGVGGKRPRRDANSTDAPGPAPSRHVTIGSPGAMAAGMPASAPPLVFGDALSGVADVDVDAACVLQGGGAGGGMTITAPA